MTELFLKQMLPFMKNMRLVPGGVIFCMLLSACVYGRVIPASPFGDHMVLQRGALAPVWGMARPGEKVTVTLGVQKRSVVAGSDGRWMVWLKDLVAGGPWDMGISGDNSYIFKDIYIGEVWLCSGQSNMDMTVAREDRYWCGVYNEQQEVAAANYPAIRVFDVPFAPSDTILRTAACGWEVCSSATAGHFSAAAYFFARELYNRYKVPVGLITTAYGASTVEAWTSRAALTANPLFDGLLGNYEAKKAVYDTASRALKNPVRDQHSPCVLYNGMVAPLIPYAVRGVLWYQGESNTQTAAIYAEQMKALIRNWRTDWGRKDLPFLFVQLANYGKFLDTMPGKGGGTTLVREQQLKSLAIANTAMVVAIDNADDPANIHPKNKQEIGRRLALAAEGLVYGEKLSYSGPLYEKMERESGAVRIRFTDVGGGLMSKEAVLKGFAIAGEDRQFVWADAKIEGGTVLVWSPAVTAPAAVRYGWGDNPIIGLYNKEGLPASPFRTDDWGAAAPDRTVRSEGASGGPLPVLETGSVKPMPEEWIDKDTRHKVIRLSRKSGNNSSFYFHNNPFAGGRMVFYSTDSNGKQIYTVDLRTLKLKQVTQQLSPMNGEIVGRKGGNVFYQVKDSVYSTNMDTRETKLLFVFPSDFKGSISTLNADETLLAGVQSGPEEREILRKYPEKGDYFNRIFDAHIPHTLFTINLLTGELKKIHREDTWLGHVQFSPTDPELLMFCHEGPWQKVDRIWTIDVRTEGVKLMHKRTVENEIAGHEFFSPDGKTIWFDWQIPKGQTFFLGGVDVHTGEDRRYQMQRDEWSIHFAISPDEKLFAGDGGDSGQVAKAKDGRWIYLFRPEDGRFVSEKLVNMKAHYYKLEPNVHFSPDGKWVIFRANFEGKEEVYAVEINK
jgi:oligogalacturonide lyase